MSNDKDASVPAWRVDRGAIYGPNGIMVHVAYTGIGVRQDEVAAAVAAALEASDAPVLNAPSEVRDA